ncbi:MAG TPA: phosphoribosylformylglycinamidine synthase subunit PurQ [Micavibrio sp.]
MEISLIVFPGTNREQDMAQAFQRLTGKPPKFIWHKDTDIGNPDLIVLPGGFSYGDYLRCGAMAAHSPVMREVISRAKRGARVMGICNGFQILVETELLPGALLRNRSLKFICKQVHLKAATNQNDFMRKFAKDQLIQVPIAHGEGNYFADASTIQQLEDQDRIAFRYCDENGVVSDAANPNGSINNIAGILSESKTILGMMPHPENATQDHQGNLSGLPLFESLIGALN